MAGTVKKVDVEDLDNGLRSITHRYRGATYVINELSYVDYQKTVKAATTPERDPETGITSERFDSDAHNAILIGKTVTENGDKITAEALYKKGTGLVRQILRDISTLHFQEEPEEDESGGDDEGEAAAGQS